MTGFSDTVILGKLDLEYTSGLPFRDYITAVIVGAEVHQYYAQGKNEEVTRILLNYAGKETVKQTMKSVGLRGVAAVASAAAWPIEWGIDRFRLAVNDKAYEVQRARYFATRAHNDASAIRAALPGETLPADVNGGEIIFDDQGWLHVSFRLPQHIPGMTPAEAFAKFETDWLTENSAAKFADDNNTLREAFGRALRPSAPQLTTDLVDRTITEGESHTFAVEASGTAPLRYVWEKDGVAFSGPGYGPSFIASEAGQYRVTVYDANDLPARSRTATLTVLPAGASVSLTSPAEGANLTGSVTVRASAAGATKVEFWLDEERRFTDTSTPFTWTWNTALEGNASHRIIARAYAGTTLLGSTPARSVTVANGPVSTCSDPGEPNDSSPAATLLAFGVAANGYVCTVTDVDWFRVDVATPAVLTFILVVPAANDYDLELFGPDAAYVTGSYRGAGLSENITHNAAVTGTYWVRVYGYPVGNGSHNTAVPYALTAGVVSGPVTILTPPQSRTVPAGASASFSVTAAGAPPLAYQWQRDGVDIPGATSPTYATPVLTLADSGAHFRVRVANAFGFALSDPATLTVSTADMIMWTGASGDGNWFNRTNWNPRIVPTASDVVQHDHGSLHIPDHAQFAVFNLVGGSLIGTFTNMGTMNWTGGSLGRYGYAGANVTIGLGGVLNIRGDADKTIYGDTTLRNAGTVNWSGAGNLVATFDQWFGSTGGILNLAEGVFNIQSDADLAALRPAGVNFVRVDFDNAGLLRKTGGAGTNTFTSSGTWTNTGIVEVQGGILQFDGGLNNNGMTRLLPGASLTLSGGSSSGRFEVDASAVLNLNGNTLTPGASFTGMGTVRLGGYVAGTLNAQNLVLDGGGVVGTFTNMGTMNWTGGSLGRYGYAGANVTIGLGGVLNIRGDADKTIYGDTTLRNAGTVNWSGAGNLVATFDQWFGSTGGILNLAEGVFNIQSDADLAALRPAGVNFVRVDFDNAGLLRKTGGAGTNTFTSSGTWTNTGIVEVQSGTLRFEASFTQSEGDTRLAGGSLSGGTFNFTGGTLSGTGTINASIVNGAVVSPGSSSGMLTINGNYTQTAAGVLQVELGGLTPGSGFGRLVVNGQATLAGALNVALVNSFTPGFSDVFPVLTYASRSGGFASIDLPNLPDALALTAQYSPTALTLLTADAAGSNATNTLAVLTTGTGLLELRFTGEPNRAYRLQASTDLIDWLDVATNSPDSGLFRFVDPEATNTAMRFYRAVTP